MSTNTRAKHFSVVVQLTTVNQEANNEKPTDDTSNAPTASTHGQCTANEVYFIDEKTLRLVVSEKEALPHIQIAYNMNFDVVYKASATDRLQQREIENVMQDLFVLRQNSTLVRFATNTEQNISFLHNVLVTAVNRQLGELHLKVKYIGLHYYDLQQERMVNMLQNSCHEASGPTEAAAQPAQASQNLHTANTTEQSSFVPPPPTHQAQGCFENVSELGKHRFRSTWILLSWLLNNYRRSIVSGHEGLEIDFVVTHIDDQTASFSVTLTVLLVYFAKMQPNERAHLMNYFKCGGLSNYVHTPLSMCLQNALKPGTNLRALLLFDVPLRMLRITRSGCALELLQLAHAIFIWRNSVMQPITDNAVHALPEKTPLPPLRALQALDLSTKPSLSPALRDLKDVVAGYKEIDHMFDVALAETVHHCRHSFEVNVARHCMAIAANPLGDAADAVAISPTTETSPDTRHDLNVALENLAKLENDIKNSRYADPLGKYLQVKQDRLRHESLKARLEFHIMFQEKAKQAHIAHLQQLESLYYRDYC